jgi:tRNA(adenine34) deaminase
MISQIQRKHFNHAIDLALHAEQEGNLPIGSVITIKDEVIAEGRNAIWYPRFDGTRHAEMEAMRSVPRNLWSRTKEMVLYTTLEPCMMCTGAILLHHIGCVIYGAKDTIGGGACVFGHMPDFLEQELKNIKWIGPALPEKCHELFSRALEMIEKRREKGLIV